jgi:patatin-like phospholipase/acyl hydrolase
LAHLEEDFHIKITDYFDLIVGTSTGGIIALALGIGLRPREIVHFYVSNGNSIFANRWPLKLRQLWHLSRYFIRNKYDSEPLEKALKDCFGDKLLAESKKRVVIPSYNIGEDDIYLFKTPHHERLRRDYKVPVWKVAMATSAAPTYFPCFRGLNDIRFDWWRRLGEYSGPNRPLIPFQIGHPIRFKSAGYSGANQATHLRS